MASLVISREDLFPVGASVAAYVAVGAGETPASGPPEGSVVATGVVASDGSLTLTGLADATTYILYASAPSYLRASTRSLSSGGESGVGVVDVFEDPVTGWPARPTVSGAPAPWPLRWVSLPGSIVSPVDLMAELDTFLPIPAGP